MKKAILASVLGIAASAFTAYGDGHILFNNYGGPVYNPVVYGNVYTYHGLDGNNVDDPGVELQLFYAYGTYSDIYSFMAVATPGVTTFINPGLNPSGAYGTATSIGSPGGYYSGPDQLLPGWMPGETVTFMVEAWETTGIYGGPTYAASLLNGRTDLWTETAGTPGTDGIDAYPLYPPGYFASGPPVLVLGEWIPEPATLGFAGLGLFGLLIFRRKKT